MTDNRRIIHLDMDAFFASIEQRDHPAYRGKPLIVAGPAEARGVVSTCSYEARVFGVHSAMPTKTALRLCPQGIFVRGDMHHYADVSRQIQAIFHEFTDQVEQVSIDEAYLDVSYHLLHYASATDIARAIQRRIYDATALTASAGVSYNKFLAKIASDLHKPCGLTVITPKSAPAFLEQLPIEKFHGIGRATAAKFRSIGIKFGRDLKQLTPDALQLLFGKVGLFYYDIVRGTDTRPVETEWVRKSYGREMTFPADIVGLVPVRHYLRLLAAKVALLLDKAQLRGRTVTLKVRYDDFQTVTRSESFHQPTRDPEILFAVANSLLAKTQADQRPVRLLGITLSNFPEHPDRIPVQLLLPLFPETKTGDPTSHQPV